MTQHLLKFSLTGETEAETDGCQRIYRMCSVSLFVCLCVWLFCLFVCFVFNGCLYRMFFFCFCFVCLFRLFCLLLLFLEFGTSLRLFQLFFFSVTVINFI